MKINKKTEKISFFPVSEQLLANIHSFNQWDEKRNQYYGLSESSSILLKYNLNLAEGVAPKINQAARTLLEQLKPVIDHIIKITGPAYCSKALITNLPSGKTIEDHVDPGWLFSIQRRYHWAISTNPETFLRIGEEQIHIETGEIWEIDNKKMHGAFNKGESNRIHFIFDLMILDEVLAATPEPFEEGSFDDRFFSIVLRKKQKTGKFEV